MDTISTAAAAVTGARHLRSSRNGQDAAASWVGDGCAAVVVCDGCSSGASSEVGARLGAALFVRALGARLEAGERAGCPATWAAARDDVTRSLAELLERMQGDRCEAIREHFLFTIVAAAATRTEAAVWALGDGAYSLGDFTRVLGPFEDNQPPYLGYDLLGEPHPAHFEIAAPGCSGVSLAERGVGAGGGWLVPRAERSEATRGIVIATDGAEDLELERFLARRFVDHPDALRRQLAVLARGPERIDWDERRIVRTPAVLQDDCAVAVLRWEAPS